jgi:bifunctional DNA-binding transcriptional regulator/antitoxin component of YhaV-PrlF toxin-antitoxin module
MSEVVVDQFGNVQIPGVILTRLGLGPGRRLVIETDEEGSIKLSPVSEEDHSASLPGPETEPVEPRRVEENGILVLQTGADQGSIKLIRKNGVLVASVEPEGDLEHAVERDRQARIEKLMEGFRP